MGIVRRIMAACYCAYFYGALTLGFKKHTWDLSNSWCADESHAKGDAAWYATQQLYKHHGYHECPSCHWATETADEHLKNPSSWCAVDYESRQVPYIPPTWDQTKADMRRLDEQVVIVVAGLDRTLRMNLKQCPRCGETLDISEFEMHEIRGCEGVRA